MALAAATWVGVVALASVVSGDDRPSARFSERSPAERDAQGPVPGRADRQPVEKRRSAKPRQPRFPMRESVALGSASAGRLLRGVPLPASGRHFFTWDPILERSPGRAWRRWGTDRLLRTLLRTVAAHRRANPGAPRVMIGDLSRPRGGDFGPRYGLPGHASHQNGLDADIYYSRLDRGETRAASPAQADYGLAQDLVDRLVAAGAEYVFVGPSTGLTGPAEVVQVLPLHDDHLHVRLPN